MNSESSEDGHFGFKDGEKDLISDKEDQLLAFEETENSATKNQCEVIKPESNAATTKKHNFSLLMSAIDFFTQSGHSLPCDESEEDLMHAVCAATPQSEPSETMDSFSSAGVDFVIDNWTEWSLSGASMPSEASDFVGETQERGQVSSWEIPDFKMVSEDAQEVDSEPGNDTNVFQQSDEVSSVPLHSPKEPLPDVKHELKLFHNEQIVIQGISIWGINAPERLSQEDIAFNGIDIAGHLLEAAAAQMELNVIVNESAVMAIANGLKFSIEGATGGDNPMIVHRGIGPMGADLLLDSQTGMVMGFAVARLVPRPILNSSGGVQGSVIHQEIRGYAIDDNARRIITEGFGTAIWAVIQPPGK